MTVLVFGVLAIWIIMFAAMAMIPLMTGDERNHQHSPHPIAMARRGMTPGEGSGFQDRAA